MPSPLPAPQVEWRGDGLPWSIPHQDGYASRAGARAEREHVFLRAHGFAAAGDVCPGRWDIAAAGAGASMSTRASADAGTAVAAPARFTFGELGFGAGVSFLVTWAAFRRHVLPRAPHAVLEWISVEGMPFDREQLLRAATALVMPDTPDGAGHVAGGAAATSTATTDASAPPGITAAPPHDLRPLARELAAAWPERIPGTHRRVLDGGCVLLTLLFGQPIDLLPKLSFTADAWNLDGFAPARNPEMWSPQVMEQLAAHSGPGTTVATYSAASAVRAGLESAGFTVETPPGFGGKRQMIVARWSTPRQAAPPARRGPSARRDTSTLPPWFAQPAPRQTCPREPAAVIGAGLAGASAARALAERGIAVHVFEARTIAGGGSGAPHAILAPHLASWHGLQARVVAQAFLHARARLEQRRVPFEPCGLLHPLNAEEAWALESVLAEWGWPPELLRVVDARNAAELAWGEPREFHAAAWVPHACVVRPAQVVRALLDHPRITLHEQTTVDALRRAGDRWQLVTRVVEVGARAALAHAAGTSSADALFETPLVILATAGAWTPRADPSAPGGVIADRTAPLAAAALPHVPLDGTRGQLTMLECSPGSRAPRVIVNAGAFALPLGGNALCAGATHERDNDSIAPTTRADALNMMALERLLPPLPCTRTGAWAGLRATVHDHLPLVGAVPDEAAFRAAFAPLKDGPRAAKWPAAPMLPGLFCSLAHGSRGTSTALLAGDLLADLVTGTTRCVADDLLPALLPQRFLVRALRRGEQSVEHSGPA